MNRLPKYGTSSIRAFSINSGGRRQSWVVMLSSEVDHSLKMEERLISADSKEMAEKVALIVTMLLPPITVKARKTDQSDAGKKFINLDIAPSKNCFKQVK
ncbi:hypothetical protein [Vogesella sp. XCS3]|uniref:hypothetical protein n=1 Tax=Vogesella sp. XCS3 TaxID=2877939 RepID=UPI001D0A2EF6|nr:hypothetical protein [Vogesella sp. XCS3]UDM18883.1 hypothetical protein LCH97_18610 [Vogesella sp. XCS3]